MRGRANVLLALIGGCSAPEPLVLCHNANCAGEVTVERDDTLDALVESLAVTHADRPAIDGIEIDITWSGGRCAFAHSPEQAESAPEASAAAELIAAHLLAADRPSWNGVLFVLKLELKPSEAADEAAHVACALDAADIVREAALAAGHELELLIDSSDAGLLRAAARDPRLADARLSADFGAPRPFTPDTPELSDFAGVPLEVAEFHPGWVADAQIDAFRSLRLDFNLWMFSANTEVLRAVDRYDPRYVTTSEAEAIRRWLER
jgi:hypothetical protein